MRSGFGMLDSGRTGTGPLLRADENRRALVPRISELSQKGLVRWEGAKGEVVRDFMRLLWPRWGAEMFRIEGSKDLR
jgi:hypothetical protein